MKNIIYGLVDPRNDLVYYVGKTSIGKHRPLQHLLKSHSKEVNSWVESLQEKWIPVKIIVLEEVQELDMLPEFEKSWINKWAFLNEDLLNKQLTEGINYDKYSEDDEEEFNNLRSALYRVGTILKRRRIAVGLKQKELSDKCNISRSTLSLLENNETVNLDTIRKVSLILEGERIKKAKILTERVRHHKFPEGH